MKRRKKPITLPPLAPLGPDERYWAIDIGRRCGWFVHGPKNFELSGVHELYDPDGLKADYMDGQRFQALSNFLDNLEKNHGKPNVIAFEEVPSGATKGRQIPLYFGMRGTLMAWAAIKGIPVCPIPVATIKEAVTGNGNASKEMMIEAARKRGYLPFDDNEADAIGIAFALNRYVSSAQNLPLVDPSAIQLPPTEVSRKKKSRNEQPEVSTSPKRQRKAPVVRNRVSA